MEIVISIKNRYTSIRSIDVYGAIDVYGVLPSHPEGFTAEDVSYGPGR